MSFITQLINSTIPSLLFNPDPTSAFTSATIKNTGDVTQTYDDPRSRNQLSTEQQNHVMQMLTTGAQKYPSTTKKKTPKLTHSKKPTYDEAKKICDKKPKPKHHCIRKMLRVYNKGSEPDKIKAKDFLRKDLDENILTADKELTLWYRSVDELYEMKYHKKERSCPDEKDPRYDNDDSFTLRAMAWAKRKCLHRLASSGDFVEKGKVVTLGGDWYQAKQNTTRNKIPSLSEWGDHDDAPPPKCTDNGDFTCIGDHLDLKEKYMVACQGEWPKKNETEFECGVWMKK